MFEISRSGDIKPIVQNDQSSSYLSLRKSEGNYIGYVSKKLTVNEAGEQVLRIKDIGDKHFKSPLAKDKFEDRLVTVKKDADGNSEVLFQPHQMDAFAGKNFKVKLTDDDGTEQLIDHTRVRAMTDEEKSEMHDIMSDIFERMMPPSPTVTHDTELPHEEEEKAKKVNASRDSPPGAAKVTAFSDNKLNASSLVAFLEAKAVEAGLISGVQSSKKEKVKEEERIEQRDEISRENRMAASKENKEEVDENVEFLDEKTAEGVQTKKEMAIDSTNTDGIDRTMARLYKRNVKTKTFSGTSRFANPP